MNFRTELKTSFQNDLIHYKSKIFTIGSCFADEMGIHLNEYEFTTVNNPFGILFNPISIFKSQENSLNQNINEDLFVERNGNWFHFDYHSDLAGTTKEGLKSKILAQQSQTKKLLLTGDVLVITLGTAWIYRHLKTNQVVANCHKIPQAEFQKELLGLEELKSLSHDFFTLLTEKNPKLKIILTVSPVRHIKDGLHENNLSKSVLLLLTNYLKDKFENVIYFPAYEFIIDDLRDYRFYKEDMIHPTSQAFEYVFEKFSDSYFSDKTKNAVKLKSSIIKAENHRFLNAKKDEINEFEKLIKTLREKFESAKS